MSGLWCRGLCVCVFSTFNLCADWSAGKHSSLCLVPDCLQSLASAPVCSTSFLLCDLLIRFFPTVFAGLVMDPIHCPFRLSPQQIKLQNSSPKCTLPLWVWFEIQLLLIFLFFKKFLRNPDGSFNVKWICLFLTFLCYFLPKEQRVLAHGRGVKLVACSSCPLAILFHLFGPLK